MATEVLQTYAQTLKEDILKRTRSFAVDGAVKERRALEYAVQTIFPNVVLIVRDAAHALRFAIKDTLHHDDVYGDVWASLFNDRHVLVPDVMNSQKWQDLLQHIQADLLRIAGESQPLGLS